MASLIAIPFLIGSVPLGLAVVGANHFLKDKRKTNKILYWGGITASAFVGWSVSNMLMTRYVESEVLGAEHTEPYYGKDGLDFGRDTKGRFRRKLVIPLDFESKLTPTQKAMRKELARMQGEIPKAEKKLRNLKAYRDELHDAIATNADWTESWGERKLDEEDDDIEVTDLFGFFDADTFTMSPDATPPFKKPQYFYRWVGERYSGNPIYFGYPDAPSYDNTLIHYVHPIYDENHVRLVVEKLNKRL